MKKRVFILNAITNSIIILVILVIGFVGMSNTKAIPVWKETGVYRGSEERPEVSLMFNVYWGTEYVEPILKILKQRNVKTTFFIGGIWASKNQETLRLIAEDGHEIGNHGYFHKDADKINYAQNYDEINLTYKLIDELIGVKTKLFAPPSGAYSDDMYRACSELNHTVIMWSRDTIDWRDKDEVTVLKRATTDIQNGDFILMHPTKHTLMALHKILENLEQKGMYVKPVSDCLRPMTV